MLDSSIDILPIATQSLIQSSLPADESSIKNVFMIYCQKTQSKGTGFLLHNGVITTNEHVIHGNFDHEIIAISSAGKQFKIKKSIRDLKRDLAILITEDTLVDGLKLDLSNSLTRQIVHTWGFPLSHIGPAPLLSVGYISGFQHTSEHGKRLVVNGAFNPGNSGGPLFKDDGDLVIGIVVAKWTIPLTSFQKSALDALTKNSSGLQYRGTNAHGDSVSFSESQLVADLLNHYRTHTQVMMGVAIEAEELANFLEENSLPAT